jgi:dinuclear metal center YbgI/SA1388 family protein
MQLSQVVSCLCDLAPLELAQSWDRVGLLIEPLRPRGVRRVLLTIDLTPSVVAEAVAKQAELVVAYHPPLFQPLTQLRPIRPQERVVLESARHRLAVFSPHTALDAVAGGINDWLCEAFGTAAVAAIAPSARARAVPEGAGRFVTLPRPLSLNGVVRRVKQHLNLERVRVARPEPEPKISRIAVCAGAGGSLFGEHPADLYLTGELSHHGTLAALGRSTAVILTEHTHSERGFLPRFAERLREATAGELVVSIAESDREPLQWV